MTLSSIKLHATRFPLTNGIRVLACLILLITSACQPLTATLLPTPEIVTIEYTPALSAWTAALNRCAISLPEIGLVTQETPADRLDPARVDFALRFGAQPELAQKTLSPFFAAVVSSDEVVLVVNPSNPIATLTRQEISAIFSRQVIHWSDLDSPKVTPQPTDTGLAIQVWSYPIGDDMRQLFDQVFMQGKIPSGETYLAPDSGAMLEALAKNPGAVGYLLKSQLNSSVHTIRITGIPASTLTQPIIALSSKEPQGFARQILLCLQSN
jgi:DNA-binding transcriptional LysR family regulator